VIATLDGQPSRTMTATSAQALATCRTAVSRGIRVLGPGDDFRTRLSADSANYDFGSSSGVVQYAAQAEVARAAERNRGETSASRQT
jgi:hypothetical protein